MRKIKDLKSKVCKDNNQYFKFISREGINVYAVEYTNDHKIRVYYRSNIIKKKNENEVKKSKKVYV